MTVFLRLLANKEKGQNLLECCGCLRSSAHDDRVFLVQPEALRTIPGAPFAYWSTDQQRSAFSVFKPLEHAGREARRGASSGDDFRRIRLKHELTSGHKADWRPLSKGGVYAPFYSDVHLLVAWDARRETFDGFFGRPGRESEKVEATSYFFRPGLTWPRRTKSRLSMRVMPAGCIFADKGPTFFVAENSHERLLAYLAVFSSPAFYSLVELQLAAADEQLGGAAHSFEVGILQSTPVPNLSREQENSLATLSRRAWLLKRTLDTVEETSHAFMLPAALRSRLRDYDPPAICAELARIQAEIDAIAFDLYGFSEADCAAARGDLGPAAAGEEVDDADSDGYEVDDEDTAAPIDQSYGLLSWAVGVAFGRFDWRLATGERAPSPEPAPFDPLPAKSPGMLPDGADPFHLHAGILVDEPGHKHDLTQLIEEVLTRVDVPVPSNVRLWLQREFFPFHLQRYSKSRRKAPIYWPLATASGGYTLWLYYPDLDSQTLYTAVNEFVEPKLKQVGNDVAALRNKGSARSRDDDKTMEALQTLEKELVELRGTLLQIAPTYQPNHDDGVQITAAPLWPLFRHKPWQKLLKETWAKLERGDYDWSHLALAYWPGQVREKCKSDKSLAIAHDLEQLYEPPPESTAGPGRGGRKRRGAAL